MCSLNKCCVWNSRVMQRQRTISLQHHNSALHCIVVDLVIQSCQYSTGNWRTWYRWRCCKSLLIAVTVGEQQTLHRIIHSDGRSSRDVCTPVMCTVVYTCLCVHCRLSTLSEEKTQQERLCDELTLDRQNVEHKLRLLQATLTQLTADDISPHSVM